MRSTSHGNKGFLTALVYSLCSLPLLPEFLKTGLKKKLGWPSGKKIQGTINNGGNTELTAKGDKWRHKIDKILMNCF